MIELYSNESIEKFIKDNKVSVLYFSSKDCNVCKALLPKIEKLFNIYNKIKLAKVEIDKVQLAAGEYSIFTLPVIILYIEGKETIREARFISISELQNKIARFYEIL
jgi:thioredoxin-like negative regulator of GroEL